MDATKIIDEIPDLKGAFIEEFFEAFRDKKCWYEKRKIANGEKIIGELNEAEKALHFLYKKYNELITEEGISRLRKKDSKIRIYIARCNAAKNLFWDSAKTRISKNGDVAPNAICGIREGHKIVLVSENPDDFNLLMEHHNFLNAWD
jgi:hypothetical protein